MHFEPEPLKFERFLWCLILYVTLERFDQINILDQWNLSKAPCPPQCGLASSNQFKAWIEQKDHPLLARRNLSAVCLQASPALSALLCLQASSSLWRSGLASLHICLNQFLIVNLFVYNIHCYIYAIGFISQKKSD